MTTPGVTSGYAPTPSGEVPVDEAFTSVPPGTPTSGYFIVPEGDAGQIVNAMTTALHASNPLSLFSLSGLRSLVDDTIESVKQTINLAKGTTTTWTTIHATSAGQVLFLENSGLTYYPTQTAAQTQANAQNRNVNPTGTGAPAVTNPLDYLQDIGNFFDKLTDPHTWLRLAEVAAGGMVLYLGIKTAFRGTAVGDVGSTAARTAKKPVKLAVKTAEKVTPAGRAAGTIARAATKAKKAETRTHAKGLKAGTHEIRNGRVVDKRHAMPKPMNKPQYTVTERSPLSGEMGGTRIVRYQSHANPRANGHTRG